MAAYNLAPVANFLSIFGSNTAASTPNNPLANGTLSTFAAGTTTPLQTYQTSTGTGWGTVITLDSTGRVPGAIWFPAGQGYKFQLKDSGGNLIPNGTIDNLIGINDSTNLSSTNEWTASGATVAYSSGSVFTTSGNTTATFTKGRRIQATVTAGTVYGTVLSSSFAASTTVTLSMDPAGVLDAGLSAVNVSIVDALGTPALLPGSFAANSISSTTTLSAGTTLSVSGTSTLTGAVSAPGGVTGNLTGNVTGTSSGLTGTSPALGTNWNVDANGQLANNGNTMYFGAVTTASATTSGTTASLTTVSAQQGGNFSVGSNAVTTTAAGLYEVTYVGSVSNTGSATINWYFVPSAGTVYGPTSANPFEVDTSLSAPFPLTLHCIWAATAGANINITSATTFTAGYKIFPYSHFLIRRIG